MLYEINYLVLQSKTQELEEIRSNVKKLIAEMGGVVGEEKNYLKRKLAYEINHEIFGFHTVLRFNMETGEKIEALRKELNLLQGVSRYIMVRAEKLPSLEEAEQKMRQSAIENEKAKPTIDQKELEKILNENERGKEQVGGDEQEKSVNFEEKASATVQPTEKEEIKKTEPEKVVKQEKSEEIEEASEEEKPTIDTSAEVIEKETETERETIDRKKETKKPEKKQDSNEDQEKVSLDELDKKLDEILNS